LDKFSDVVAKCQGPADEASNLYFRLTGMDRNGAGQISREAFLTYLYIVFHYDIDLSFSRKASNQLLDVVMKLGKTYDLLHFTHGRDDISLMEIETYLHVTGYSSSLAKSIFEEIHIFARGTGSSDTISRKVFFRFLCCTDENAMKLKYIFSSTNRRKFAAFIRCTKQISSFVRFELSSETGTLGQQFVAAFEMMGVIIPDESFVILEKYGMWGPFELDSILYSLSLLHDAGLVHIGNKPVTRTTLWFSSEESKMAKQANVYVSGKTLFGRGSTSSKLEQCRRELSLIEGAKKGSVCDESSTEQLRSSYDIHFNVKEFLIAPNGGIIVMMLLPISLCWLIPHWIKTRVWKDRQHLVYWVIPLVLFWAPMCLLCYSQVALGLVIYGWFKTTFGFEQFYPMLLYIIVASAVSIKCAYSHPAGEGRRRRAFKQILQKLPTIPCTLPYDPELVNAHDVIYSKNMFSFLILKQHNIPGIGATKFSKWELILSILAAGLLCAVSLLDLVYRLEEYSFLLQNDVFQGTLLISLVVGGRLLLFPLMFVIVMGLIDTYHAQRLNVGRNTALLRILCPSLSSRNGVCYFDLRNPDNLEAAYILKFYLTFSCYRFAIFVSSRWTLVAMLPIFLSYLTFSATFFPFLSIPLPERASLISAITLIILPFLSRVLNMMGKVNNVSEKILRAYEMAAHENIKAATTPVEQTMAKRMEIAAQELRSRHTNLALFKVPVNEQSINSLILSVCLFVPLQLAARVGLLSIVERMIGT
jgi:hypothetical protein